MLINPGGPFAGAFQSIISAILGLQQPGAPSSVFACTTAQMPPAAKFKSCLLLNTTLNILAHSDGANWIREDTGGAI